MKQCRHCGMSWDRCNYTPVADMDGPSSDCCESCDHGDEAGLPACEWCRENDCDHRRVGSKPFAAWVGPERDGDGQPTTIHVSYTSGEHVGEGEAEFVRRALREYVDAPSSSAPTVSADRVIDALRKAWDDTCAGYNDACESCRAYAEAIRTVKWVREAS